jgi:hypothetical protein
MSGRLILLTHQTPFRPRSDVGKWRVSPVLPSILIRRRPWEGSGSPLRREITGIFGGGLRSRAAKPLFGAGGVFQGFNRFDSTGKDWDGDHLRDFVAGTELD